MSDLLSDSIESFLIGLQRGRIDLCYAVILGCWCLLWLDQAEMQDSKDTSVGASHRAGKHMEDATTVSAIAVLAGEAISLSPLEKLRVCELFQPHTGTKHFAHTWITQTSLDRRRLV